MSTYIPMAGARLAARFADLHARSACGSTARSDCRQATTLDAPQHANQTLPLCNCYTRYFLFAHHGQHFTLPARRGRSISSSSRIIPHFERNTDGLRPVGHIVWCLHKPHDYFKCFAMHAMTMRIHPCLTHTWAQTERVCEHCHHLSLEQHQ